MSCYKFGEVTSQKIQENIFCNIRQGHFNICDFALGTLILSKHPICCVSCKEPFTEVLR